MKSRNQYSTYLIVSFAKFVGVIALLMMPLQVGSFIDGLQIGEARVGLLAMLEVFSLGASVLLASTGIIKLPLNRLAILGAGLALAANLATAFTETYSTIAVYRVISGFGMGLINAAATMSIVRCFKDADKAAGHVYSLVYIASTALYILSPTLSEYGHYRGLFGGLAILFAFAIPVLRLLPAATLRNESADSTDPLPWRAICLLFAAQAPLLIGLGACWSFAERMGLASELSLSDVAYYLAWSNVATIVGALCAGLLGTTYGRRLPVLSCAVGTPLACLLMSSTLGQSTYVIALMTYQLGISFLFPYLIGTGALMDPKGRVSAAVIGSVVFFFGAGAAIGGWLIELLSLQALGWMAVSLGAVSFVLFSILLSPQKISKFER